jgi:hypothetical protein
MFKHLLTIVIVVAALVGGFFAFNTSKEKPAPLTPPVATSTIRETPPGWREYRNEQYLFSVLYPEGMKVAHGQDGDALIVTFEDAAVATGFQIFVIPYSQPVISEERFRADVPSGVREGEEKTYIDGAEAVQFFSTDMALGETREIWFIKKPYLYEVTTLRALDPWLQEIMETWQFL